MKLWGGYLPFIGFRDHPVDEDMRYIFRLKPGVEKVTCFEAAWFGYGVSFALIPGDDVDDS